MQNSLINSSLVKDYASKLGTKVKYKFEPILLSNSYQDNGPILEFWIDSKAKTNQKYLFYLFKLVL